jgi:hypothetical protein
VFGTSVPLKNMIAYTHMMEFLPGRVTEISGILFFIDGMVLVICPLALQFVTNNTAVFVWAGIIQNVIALIAFMFIRVPESVIFQLEKHQYAQAKKDIEYILEFNKAKSTERDEAL